MLIESKRSILVLLAGTSGTGKSTLASLLGSRLGISTVLSTDTIRHVMRNFISREECPILFASTYETANFVYSFPL
jgi:2-phosphoglycerate kinase